MIYQCLIWVLESQEVGNIWRQNDWNFPILIKYINPVIHEAPKTSCLYETTKKTTTKKNNNNPKNKNEDRKIKY